MYLLHVIVLLHILHCVLRADLKVYKASCLEGADGAIKQVKS